MYINRRLNYRRLFQYSWKFLLILTTFSILVVALYEYWGWDWMHIPFEILTIIGIAVAFYIGFKNNSAYDRTWEARKIWGAIVNSSRSWGIMVKDYITDQFSSEDLNRIELHSIHKELIYRHISWIYVLRRQLWKPKNWEHNKPASLRRKEKLMKIFADNTKEDEMLLFLDKEEVNIMLQKKNIAAQLISKQSERLRELRQRNLINDFYHIEMKRMLSDLYTQQGKCERIKNFPLPRQFATSSYLFILIFVYFMPFGLMTEFHKLGTNLIWFTVPFTVLVGWIFWIMELIGEYAANPFERMPFDIPMTSICRNIEIDLREMLGETELPEEIKPYKDILL
jgi:ion channel-forming bestrophin family protein